MKRLLDADHVCRNVQDGSVKTNGDILSFNEFTPRHSLAHQGVMRTTRAGLSTVIVNPNNICYVLQDLNETPDSVSDLSSLVDALE